MKLDKDTVIKHHFWFLLATAMPLALVGIVLLMTVVSSLIASNRKKLEDDLKSKKVSDPAKNQQWIDEIQKYVAKMKKREKEVWEAAYHSQEYLFSWPEEMEKNFKFKDGLFASEIKGEKAAGAPVDPKTEEHNVIKHLNGTVEGTAPLKDDEGNEIGVVVMQVNDGKTTRVIRPTRKMNLVKSDGKKLNTFVDFQKGDHVAITYVQGKYFNDALTEEEQNYFRNPAVGYRTQIAGIIKQVQPLEKNGRGVVQVGGWLYSERQGIPDLPPENSPFLRFVAKEWDPESDVSAEAWMAQEDLWIQRELYRLIRQSNDMVSVLDGKGGTDQGKWYTFTNPYWKLELNWGGKQLHTKITNLLPRRQRLDLDFLVTFREGENVEPERIRIGGEPLDPNKTYPQSISLQGVPPTGIYRVEQAINWETAAVKRIDHVSIGSLAAGDCCHSHRTFPDGLKSLVSKPAPAQDGGGVKLGTPEAQNVGSGDDKMKNLMRPGGGGLGMNKTDSKKTKNGLNAERYLEQPTAEVRKVPFGISLIVGQEHIDRVLFAFSKSPLRILMTQVIVDRYPHSVRPTGVEQAAQSITVGKPAGAGAGVGGGMMSFPGSYSRNLGGYGANRGGGFGGPGFGSGPGFGLGGTGQSIAPVGGDSQETNVELVIYGIAPLYQRYPPRPPEAAPQVANP